MTQSYASPKDTTAQSELSPAQTLPMGSNAAALDEMSGQQPSARDSLLGDLLGTGQGSDAAEQAKAEEAEFLKKTWPPLADFATGTGGIFDAALAGKNLTITLKVAFDFVAGDPMNAPAGVPPEEFQWTEEGKSEFRQSYLSSVASSWSGKHQIRSTKPFWSTTISTSVVVIEDNEDPHFKVGVMKFPDDVYPHIGVVHPSGTHSEHHDGTSDRYKRIPNAPGDEAGQGWLDSKATRENYPEAERAADDPKRRAPRQSVYFAIGQSNIDPSSQATIDGVAHEMHENPSWRAELQGRASADGDAASNFALSRERSASVKSTLEGDGIPSSRIVVQNVGEEGGYKGHYWKAKDNDTTARRVDIDLVAGTDQQAASHEAGHMFGLGDEYPGKGEAPGGAYDADYMKLISENSELPAEGGPSQGKAKTGSIMSEGMEVKNWHYAPFVAALKQITGSNDWTV